MWNLQHRTQLCQQPETPKVWQYQLCLANLAKLFFWLGWLQATKGFSLWWCDVECITLGNAKSRGTLPMLGHFFSNS
jgi:hypothetical protein